MNYKHFGLVGMIAAVGFFAAFAAPAYAAVTLVSAKVTGPHAITIVYSQPVTTNAGDYSNFQGSLANVGLVGLTGSGTNTVTLNFSGSTLGPDATGYVTIGPNIYGISDNTYFSGGAYQVTDGQPPTLASVSISSDNASGTFASVGSTITVTFTTNEQVSNPSVTIAGHSVSLTGGGMGPWTARYTMQAGDTQYAIPIGLTVSDMSGNQLQASFSATVGAQTVNGTQMIASITSNANYGGVLRPGNSITFTLTPTSPQPNGTVTGSYNGVPLSWTTANGGSTFTATYIVQSGQSDEAAPLQITGVTLTTNGVTSAPAQGYDVQKTIDANVPVLSVLTPPPATTSSPTPTFTFTSSKAGTITYNGGCSSAVTTANLGANTITFNPLPNATYGNCKILVTDFGGNLSNALQVPMFTVSASGSAAVTSTISSGSSGSSDALSQLAALQAQLAALQAQQAQQSGGGNTVSAYRFTRFLEVGMTGADVTVLQKLLTSLGFYNGPVTGKFGALTEAAVKRYQKAHGIDAKGYVGPGTRAALNTGK